MKRPAGLAGVTPLYPGLEGNEMTRKCEKTLLTSCLTRNDEVRRDDMSMPLAF